MRSPGVAVKRSRRRSLDATLVTSHSDKENVAGTYKGGYGFAPFTASADYGTARGAGEILAVLLRPGNAGANSADDHIRVFGTATAQLPDGFHDAEGMLDGRGYWSAPTARARPGSSSGTCTPRAPSSPGPTPSRPPKPT